MTPEEIRQAVDDALVPYAGEIATRQAAFYATDGKYFQGLQVPASAIPADGATMPPDFPTAPTDQPETWTPADFPATMPGAIRIDTYSGDVGKGYVIILLVMIAGARWERHINAGPEMWRNKAWFEAEAA